jgi:hypothetical protein
MRLCVYDWVFRRGLVLGYAFGHKGTSYQHSYNIPVPLHVTRYFSEHEKKTCQTVGRCKVSGPRVLFMVSVGMT